MPIRSGARCRARLACRLTSSRGAIAGIAAFAAFWPNVLATSTLVEAKTPGKTYCFYKVCHRVMTLDETNRAVGKRMIVHASHYDDPRRDRFNPSNLTSSGELFRPGTPDNAASPKLPNGTVILAWNPATRQSAVLRINNAGPYWRNRTLDVSRAAADRLGFGRAGVAPLHIQVISAATREDVTYRKGRRYAAVPGPIGTYASFELAALEASRRMGIRVDPPASTVLVASAGGAELPYAADMTPADAIDAATALAHLPGELPATTTTIVADAAIPPPPEIDGDLAPPTTLVSATAAADDGNPAVALASAAAAAPDTPTATKRTAEDKIVKARRPLRPSRQMQLASLNAAPTISSQPPRRRAVDAASQRKQVAALERRRDRREVQRTVSRSAQQMQQQRLADLDDFDDDDIRPARTMRRLASGRTRNYED